jgi:hypothetical protein
MTDRRAIATSRTTLARGRVGKSREVAIIPVTDTSMTQLGQRTGPMVAAIISAIQAAAMQAAPAHRRTRDRFASADVADVTTASF